MIWKKSGEVELTIFRDELSKKEKFTIKDGECDALIKRLQSIEPSGMARPSLLPWREKHDGVIIVSDGEFAEGFQGIPEKVDYPLFAFLAKDSRNYLTDLSTLSLNAGSRNIGLSSVSFGKLGSHFIYSGIDRDENTRLIQHKAAYWLWAYHSAKQLKARGESSGEISDFHTEHQVADGDYSWIVLENINQHIQYNIPPPETNPELMAGWRKHMNGEKERLNQRLIDYAIKWGEHCFKRSKPMPLFKQFALGLVVDDVEYWKAMPNQVVVLSKEERQFLNDILAKVRQETDEKIIYDQLREYTKFRNILFARQKVMYISISGQVEKPGPTLMPFRTPIHDAVKLAKPTTFAALNRVELLRNGKVYKYNMKIPEHQREILYPNDVISVREKRWLGNGGRVNKEPVPFEDKSENQKYIEKEATLKKMDLKWDKKKTYLQTLSVIPLKDLEKWHKSYLKQREMYGWRADFYEDIICYLLDKKAKKLTSRVAQDLAELHPDNPEILRRAGRAFFRNGDLEIAKRIFQRIAFLTDNGEAALYDLARVFEREKNYKEASKFYYEAIKSKRSTQAESRVMVYLEEMNGCIHKGKINPDDIDIDPSLVRHLPLDIKVNLIWDSEKANVDLVVKNTLLDIYQGAMYDDKYNFWVSSGDVTQGIGPESSAIREKLIGDYNLTAKFHGDWDDNHKSDTTVSMEVIRNFGSEMETRESITRRLHEGEREVLMKLEVSPKKK